MPKPVIFALDDDTVVLNAVDRDLRQRYGAQFRILSINSANVALGALGQLRERGELVVLFLVDQRMPQMNGIQFLEQALRIYPQARRILLTAYADTEAAIQGINLVRLDHYLMKPWDPPDKHLYPVLDRWLGIGETDASGANASQEPGTPPGSDSGDL